MPARPRMAPGCWEVGRRGPAEGVSGRPGPDGRRYINSAGLIGLLLTARHPGRPGRRAGRRQRARVSPEEGGGGRPRGGKGSHSGPGTGRPGSAAPLPPRNRTRRSPPPAPSLRGPSQSPGSTGSRAPSSAAAATGPEDPSAPLEPDAPSGRPNPRVPSARPGLPLPRSPGPG